MDKKNNKVIDKGDKGYFYSKELYPSFEEKKEYKRYSRENPFIYENNYYYDYFRAIPFDRLNKLLNKSNINLDNKTILFASCGCGMDAHYLKKYYKLDRICFTDVYMRPMEKTRSNFFNELFVLTDNQKLAFKDNSFDFVFIADSLHHLKEPLKGLYELLRIVRFGLIVIEPNDSWLTRLFEKFGWADEYEVEHANYIYRFNKREVDKISKALFFKNSVSRFFAIHRIAKTKAEFTILRILNCLANFFFSYLGNYIVFLIKKEHFLPKCMQGIGNYKENSKENKPTIHVK